MNTWQRSWTKAVLGDSHNKTHREDGGIRKAKPQAWMIRKSWRSSDAFLNLLCLEITKDLLLSCESQYCSGFSWKLHHISADFSAFSLKAKNCKSTINILLSLTKLLASEKILILALLDPIWITHLLSEGVWKLMGGIKKNLSIFLTIPLAFAYEFAANQEVSEGDSTWSFLELA